MTNEIEEKLIILLKKVCNEKVNKNINLLNIYNNRKLILEGILFDDENTCYHSYEDIEDVITSLMVSADNYGIYLENKFIGIISVFNHYYKDLTRLEISICIKKDYRNKKIGEYCFNQIISNYFKKNNIKSIHLSIRCDNIKSIRLAEKCGFKLYTGYKIDNVFIDKNNNIQSQVQYLLKKNDYMNS